MSEKFRTAAVSGKFRTAAVSGKSRTATVSGKFRTGAVSGKLIRTAAVSGKFWTATRSEKFETLWKCKTANTVYSYSVGKKRKFVTVFGTSVSEKSFLPPSPEETYSI